MAWSKAKKTIVAGVGVVVMLFVVVGAIHFIKWLRDPERIALATGERAIAKHLAEPLDLTGHYQQPAPDVAPTGFQTFNNVPLQIDGMMCLWGAGGTNRGMDCPEEITDIAIDQKFETLYVYHGAYFKSSVGAPVYDIVFHYDDGSSATNTILYGKDVLDWFVGNDVAIRKMSPTAARSKLAWHGEADFGNKKQMLRYCLTAVENPQPTSMVASIDLYSRKSRTVACILAMTPGKAGLMK